MKNVLGWHDAVAYMASLRRCIEKRRAEILTLSLHGEQYICALVPLSTNTVCSHRLRVHENYSEALRVLMRLAFGKNNG